MIRHPTRRERRKAARKAAFDRLLSRQPWAPASMRWECVKGCGAYTDHPEQPPKCWLCGEKMRAAGVLRKSEIPHTTPRRE